MITGTTGLIAHIGVPTETFTAPKIYNPWFAATGTDAVVVPMGCEAGDLSALLPALFRLRNITGALITMPHKTDVVTLLDEASPAVRLCGACNAVRRDAAGRLIGEMFDGTGFLSALQDAGYRVAGTRVLIIGAGGVASAIAASLLAAGAADIRLTDRIADRAEALTGRLRQAFPSVQINATEPDPEGCDLVVNATPAGMHADDPLPLDPAHLTAEMRVCDVVLRPDTPLLVQARNRGCATQAGQDMLFAQIPAFLAFFGLPVAIPAELHKLARL